MYIGPLLSLEIISPDKLFKQPFIEAYTHSLWTIQYVLNVQV